jgi:hypothetical protein
MPDPDKIAQRYAREVQQHEKNERELSRAMRKWDKSRQALNRLNKRLDREQAARMSMTIEANRRGILDDMPQEHSPANP